MTDQPATAPDAPEFSRLVPLHEVKEDGLQLTFEASAAERAALARRFELLDLVDMQARLRLSPTAEGGLLLNGHVDARLIQACVISGEPVKSSIASDFSVRYISPVNGMESLESEEFDVLEEDMEPLPSDVIDVGEVVAQYLSLALDPYPRKPGAEVGVVELTPDGPVPGTERANPFAALRKLQDKG